MTLQDVTDYIILKVTEGGGDLNLLKLQKLVYYSQAWHLATAGEPLFDGRFQAWIHGPVSRELYDRFANTKSLYSQVWPSNVTPGFDPDSVPLAARAHIDAVLEAYVQYSGSQLEEMTHREEPWQLARKGYAPSQRCEVEIDEAAMSNYYGARLGEGD
ncbi:Panacea domain-containing protein [Zavarzinella formosa]|uniref:Panacea domain-containing protein n=1 Tax=Zavarzinella formosa TaxID=360055 RepID=UPI000379BA32|nr:type II toxin-antitoxin system antitoxin SocA domain-containing protein [Zavarzinella formosa]